MSLLANLLTECATASCAITLQASIRCANFGLTKLPAVARLHIIADLKQEGWTEDQPFPCDEQHYKGMGLF
jgi:hypothetical protein